MCTSAVGLSALWGVLLSQDSNINITSLHFLSHTANCRAVEVLWKAFSEFAIWRRKSDGILGLEVSGAAVTMRCNDRDHFTLCSLRSSFWFHFDVQQRAIDMLDGKGTRRGLKPQESRWRGFWQCGVMTLHLKEISKSLASSVAASDFCLTRNRVLSIQREQAENKTSSAARGNCSGSLSGGLTSHTAHIRVIAYAHSHSAGNFCRGLGGGVGINDRSFSVESGAFRGVGRSITAMIAHVDLRLPWNRQDHRVECSSYLRACVCARLSVPVCVTCPVCLKGQKHWLIQKNHSREASSIFFQKIAWKEKGNFFMDSFSPSVCVCVRSLQQEKSGRIDPGSFISQTQSSFRAPHWFLKNIQLAFQIILWHFFFCHTAQLRDVK